MRHGSLFSGIGGFDLAAEWIGWENVFHCEWIKDKQDHLKSKWPSAISYGDIETTDFTIHRGRVDILTGGFPCQDASIAKQDGKGQQGLQGERTGLAFQMLRAINEIRPKFVVAENVANFLKVNGGSDARTILTELARLGYNAEWRICRASEVGAPHQILVVLPAHPLRDVRTVPAEEAVDHAAGGRVVLEQRDQQERGENEEIDLPMVLELTPFDAARRHA